MTTQTITVTTTWQNICDTKLEGYFGVHMKEQQDNKAIGSIFFLENGEESLKEVTISQTRGIKIINYYNMSLPNSFHFEKYPARVYEIQKTVDDYLQIRLSSGTDISVKFRLFSDIPNKNFVLTPKNNSTNKNTFFRIGTFNFPKIEKATLDSVSWVDGTATSYTIRIFNLTDNTILLETILTNSLENINNLGSLTNLPNNSFHCEISVKRNNGNNSSKVHIVSLTINYV
jgi:hypothetical protein